MNDLAASCKELKKEHTIEGFRSGAFYFDVCLRKGEMAYIAVGQGMKGDGAPVRLIGVAYAFITTRGAAVTGTAL